MTGQKITISVIKADIGGYVGHATMHPDLVTTAKECLEKEKKSGLLIDFCVMYCGDDLELIMTHDRDTNSQAIHKLAWDTFMECTKVAKKLGLYGAGQDLLADAFSGNVKGQGPGVAEMSFIEREGEPVLIFMADKTSPGAWNLPLFKMFGDPFNTAGLIIDLKCIQGFRFDVLDVKENKLVSLNCPDEMYDLLVLIGATEDYMINGVYRRSDGEVAAIGSVQKLNLIAGKYVGKDDPVLIVRAQSGFPAVGEILEAFSFPHTVAGWMRGSHNGPLMPVPWRHATPSRFDGPPRVIVGGFQIQDGKLIGPVDLFDDPSFDETRRLANQVGEYFRRHGPFEPHRLPLDSLEYTTLS